MANRAMKKFTVLNAGATDNTDSPVIPSGKRLVITRFGAADINTGDSKSSAYLLQWGSGGSFQELAAICVTGNTFEYELEEELVGNGVKFLRIVRQNNSATNKRCPVWVKGYDS